MKYLVGQSVKPPVLLWFVLNLAPVTIYIIAWALSLIP